jgi:hypothetical protein
MEKIGIEFKQSSTGMYSPWHLDIAHEYGVGLMITSDMGNFVKIGGDIYKLRHPRDMHKLYQYVTLLEEMNDKGEASDEEVLKEIDDIINNRNKDFTLEKCVPLEEFEKQIIDMKRKQI